MLVTPLEAYREAVLNNNHEYKDIIATSPEYSFWYAFDVLKGRFVEGEDSIAKVAIYSYRYAKDILKGPFPQGEETLKGSTYYRDYLELL